MKFFDVNWEAVRGEDAFRSLATDGVVLLKEATEKNLLEFLGTGATIYRHPHSDVTGVTIIEPHDDSADKFDAKGFTRGGLTLHTDRSTVDEPPSILATIIAEPAKVGGEILLKDGRILIDSLERAGFTREDLASLYLETAARARYSVFRFNGTVCKIRYRDDDVARPQAPQPLGQIVSQLDYLLSEGIQLNMAAGEGYMIHNHRYMHGRKSFSGSRKAARLLATVRPDSPFAWINDGFICPEK